jgi:siroheme synthase-like protein
MLAHDQLTLSLPMFPLTLNVQDRICVVIGGGLVGRRRAKKLRQYGALVRLICLEERPAAEVDAGLKWLTEPYRAEHLQGAFLVFAAATPAVNRQVLADARTLGILANSATAPEESDFHLPAILQRGSLQVAISTGGQAPGLAREVRLLLEELLSDPFEHWLELVAELRTSIREQVAEEAQRRELLARLCGRQWLQRLGREDIESVRQAMLEEIRAALNPPADSV